MTDRIPTDLRLFGFPVVYDWRADRNVVELRNGRGDSIRIVIEPEKAARSVEGSIPQPSPADPETGR